MAELVQHRANPHRGRAVDAQAAVRVGVQDVDAPVGVRLPEVARRLEAIDEAHRRDRHAVVRREAREGVLERVVVLVGVVVEVVQPPHHEPPHADRGQRQPHATSSQRSDARSSQKIGEANAAPCSGVVSQKACCARSGLKLET